jgi:hypothetical protein
MRTLPRLGWYAVTLAVLFVGSFAVARAVVPESTADEWAAGTEGEHAEGGHGEADSDHDEAGPGEATEAVPGLSIEQDGYLLHDVTAPTTVGPEGVLTFALTDPDGRPVTAYETSHEKDLHLIVVRTDGSGFRHVHPATSGDGTWSIPWRWVRAGSYRMYADFVPAATGEEVTLTHTLEVAGPVGPARERVESDAATVDGFTVRTEGEVAAGEESTLAFTVTRDGTPVTTLEPYLGAYGHLVALREGDLAYLHVHPMGEPDDGATPPGPTIEFMVETPTPGSYLLYLDFQVDGTVHTAEFAVTAH